jgi:hypothetical protein
MKIIKATFKGRDGSLGFKKDKEYTLTIKETRYHIVIMELGTNLYCEYSSIISFLDNWDHIYDQQSDIFAFKRGKKIEFILKNV